MADMEQWKTLEREAPCTMLRRKSARVNCFICARTQRWSIRSTRGACRLWTSSSIQPHEFRGLSYASNHNQIAYRCYWALAHQILKFYYLEREREIKGLPAIPLPLFFVCINVFFLASYSGCANSDLFMLVFYYL